MFSTHQVRHNSELTKMKRWATTKWANKKKRCDFAVNCKVWNLLKGNAYAFVICILMVFANVDALFRRKFILSLNTFIDIYTSVGEWFSDLQCTMNKLTLLCSWMVDRRRFCPSFEVEFEDMSVDACCNTLFNLWSSRSWKIKQIIGTYIIRSAHSTCNLWRSRWQGQHF